MTPPAGQESESSSQSMELDQIEEKLTCESKSEDRSGQKSASISLSDDGLVDAQNSSGKSEVLQGGASNIIKGVTNKSEEIPPSIRGGDNGSRDGQENDYKSVHEDENTGIHQCIPSRRPKVPLAEQGVAFQAALQQSKEAPPSAQAGKGTAKKWTKERKIQAAAVAAESPRVAALKKQKEKEKRARKKENKRRRSGDS